MRQKRNSQVREPLIHLSRRDSIAPVKAWAIRLAAIVLGLLVCGLVAFILIEKLRDRPERIGDV